VADGGTTCGPPGVSVSVTATSGWTSGSSEAGTMPQSITPRMTPNEGLKRMPEGRLLAR
jgi:hypothetical protein